MKHPSIAAICLFVSLLASGPFASGQDIRAVPPDETEAVAQAYDRFSERLGALRAAIPVDYIDICPEKIHIISTPAFDLDFIKSQLHSLKSLHMLYVAFSRMRDCGQLSARFLRVYGDYLLWCFRIVKSGIEDAQRIPSYRCSENITPRSFPTELETLYQDILQFITSEFNTHVASTLHVAPLGDDEYPPLSPECEKEFFHDEFITLAEYSKNAILLTKDNPQNGHSILGIQYAVDVPILLYPMITHLKMLNKLHATAPEAFNCQDAKEMFLQAYKEEVDWQNKQIELFRKHVEQLLASDLDLTQEDVALLKHLFDIFSLVEDSINDSVKQLQ